MTHEQTLRRRLVSLGVLGEAVNAMKSLSAHHLRTARAGLTAARAYHDGIADLLAAAAISQVPPAADRPAVLVVAADLGLCDGYNAKLTDAAIAERGRHDAAHLYCVGRRPLAAFRRIGTTPTRTYPAAASVAGLTSLLLTLADDVLGDYVRGVFTALHVVSARFDGVGAFTPVVTPVLPIVPARRMSAPIAVRYVSTRQLMRVAIREYLYSTLYELLLDALAAEHGMRLVATQSAGQWLDDGVRQLRRQLASVKRESSTQEVLEIAAATRQRREEEDRAASTTS
jgi:F-type H+-transporting ATPase subunit gamma